jgi:ABC-type microcin C transport system duplicated ATPase subunit YejF
MMYVNLARVGVAEFSSGQGMRGAAARWLTLKPFLPLLEECWGLVASTLALTFAR